MEKNKLSGKDLDQLKENRISLDIFRTQLDHFEDGFPCADLSACATVGNGIFSLTPTAITKLREGYKKYREYGDIVKFVPASGAATRMFKDLYSLYNSLKELKEVILSDSLVCFFDNLHNFAFYEPLKKELMDKGGKDVDILLNQKIYLPILETLLEKGLGYGKLPKALLLFHKYDFGNVTSMEEHFSEGAQYASSKGFCNLHFTISEEHKDLFLKKVKEIQALYEERFGLKYNISYSVQKSSTDTVAVTRNNEIFRNENQRMVFRPGGHGALIENLNDIKADIVFIKNIDNVTTTQRRNDTIVYKEALAGLLVESRERTFEILRLLESTSSIANLQWLSILQFVKESLQIRLPIEFTEWSMAEQKAYLFQILNRPMRVCGMVKNEGEPGGGPFWVSRIKTYHEEIEQEEEESLKVWPVESLQIVESSQIDHDIEEQEAIFKNSTHFNPVDLVCGLRDYKGNKFDLKNFVDNMTAFISTKSVKGTEIKAMELPGLWNGAMADWITLFVEEPISVFTPVKTVNDLLRDVHQS